MKSTKIKKARIGPFFTENVKEREREREREREIRQLLTTSDLKFEASKQFFLEIFIWKIFWIFCPVQCDQMVRLFSIFGN